MRTLIIKENDAGQRLDKFLNKTLKTLPTSLMYKQIRTKKIKVNRKRTEPKYILQNGDTVELFIAEEFFEKASVKEPFTQLKANLDVVYEDKNILLADKRSGLIVHSDSKEDTNTLINHIKSYLYHKGEYDPENEYSFAPALCNRIDRNTGGIVIAAKNAETLRILNQKIKDREITKKYLLAVHGRLSKPTGILKNFILKDENTNTVKVYEKQVKGSKTAETKYRVIEEKNNLSLVEAELMTGRTHQIRAQFSYIGHPLLGDGKYGINKDDRKSGYKSQALYSYKIAFDFTTESGILSYLKGKSFEVKKNNIYFLKEFN
ncbi:MAG: RluA family pseudouridine synthase [Ruminococcaceae bacterium]|nr:RluA family pseudouridine synthase [Oscillospiraceae bacterium]